MKEVGAEGDMILPSTIGMLVDDANNLGIEDFKHKNETILRANFHNKMIFNEILQFSRN